MLNSQFIQRYYHFSFALCVIPSRLINRFIFFTDRISYQFHFLKRKSPLLKILITNFLFFLIKYLIFDPAHHCDFPTFRFRPLMFHGRMTSHQHFESDSKKIRHIFREINFTKFFVKSISRKLQVFQECLEIYLSGKMIYRNQTRPYFKAEILYY